MKYQSKWEPVPEQDPIIARTNLYVTRKTLVSK
jgi:hypothetical protein